MRAAPLPGMLAHPWSRLASVVGTALAQAAAEFVCRGRATGTTTGMSGAFASATSASTRRPQRPRGRRRDRDRPSANATGVAATATEQFATANGAQPRRAIWPPRMALRQQQPAMPPRNRHLCDRHGFHAKANGFNRPRWAQVPRRQRATATGVNANAIGGFASDGQSPSPTAQRDRDGVFAVAGPVTTRLRPAILPAIGSIDRGGFQAAATGVRPPRSAVSPRPTAPLPPRWATNASNSSATAIGSYSSASDVCGGDGF